MWEPFSSNSFYFIERRTLAQNYILTFFQHGGISKKNICGVIAGMINAFIHNSILTGLGKLEFLIYCV